MDEGSRNKGPRAGLNHMMELEESRRRCLEEYSLTPDSVLKPHVLTHHELSEKLDNHEDFLRTAMTEVDQLFHLLVDNEYMVSIAAPDGTMLMFKCDYQILGNITSIGVIPGSNWSEENQGTNGIGTCLQSGRAIAVVGEQHFDLKNQNVTCFAAPIFGRDGAIEGILNVTSSQQEATSTIRLVGGLVTRSAARIERRSFVQRNSEYRVLRLMEEKAYSDLATETLLSLNDRNEIVDVTENAIDLFGSPRGTILGKSFQEFLDIGYFPGNSKTEIAKMIGPRPRELFASLIEPSSTALRNAHSVKPAIRQRDPNKKIEIDTSRLLLDPYVSENVALGKKMLLSGLNLSIYGETGVGKNILSLLLDAQEEFSDYTLVTINCSTVVHEDTFEAISHSSGVIVVLDHVDRMLSSTQDVLIDFLSYELNSKNRKIMLISLANQSLDESRKTGSLRLELCSRLQGFEFELAPLRAWPMLDHAISEVFKQETKAIDGGILEENSKAWAALRQYHWPGNLLELRRVCRHAAALSRDSKVEICDLPDEVASCFFETNLLAKSDAESARIEAALKHNNGNVSKTAEYLGISRATLYRKIQIEKVRGKAQS